MRYLTAVEILFDISTSISSLRSARLNLQDQSSIEPYQHHRQPKLVVLQQRSKPKSQSTGERLFSKCSNDIYTNLVGPFIDPPNRSNKIVDHVGHQ